MYSTKLFYKNNYGMKMSKVIVRKPTEEEKAAILKQSTWGCKPSTFDWFVMDL
jgi:hypothetical protein